MLADLDFRLRRLYQALGDLRTPDVTAVTPEHYRMGNWCYVAVDFASGVSETELSNAIALFVANIACLKDHLKAWCIASASPFHGDTLINGNRDVAVIHDLWNRDKHYSLSQSRSGLWPILKGLTRAARLSVGGTGAASITMSLDPRTGELRIERTGEAKDELVIDADVVDSSGQRIGSLLAIAESAVTAWEATFAAAGVPLPPRTP
jgi:hypothetical protein